MTEPTAWAHLPNAAHIDRVLAHLAAHPEKWKAVWDTARGAIWDAGRAAAWDAGRDAARAASRGVVRDAARGAAWAAARDAAQGVAWYAAWAALSALTAWDDCAELLSKPPAMVKLLAEEGMHAAVLLYAAVLAMHDER